MVTVVSLELELDDEPAGRDEDGDPDGGGDEAGVDGRHGDGPAAGHHVADGLARGRARQVVRHLLQANRHALQRPDDA